MVKRILFLFVILREKQLTSEISVSQTQFKGQIESVRIKSKNVIDVSDIKRCGELHV